MAILAIVFSFVFYFVSAIMAKSKNVNEKPYMLDDYNYSNLYCDADPEHLSVIQTLDLSAYISTSTPITSIHIFHKNRMIITTNSASTTEKDMFLFDFSTASNQIDLTLLYSVNVGPGFNDSILHDTFIYALDTSINSHVRVFSIPSSMNLLTSLGLAKIDELHASGALPKKGYVYDKKLLIGTEKNNSGGELFILPIDENNLLKTPTKSIEIGGQVSDIYERQENIFIANASDTELFVFDKNLAPLYSYDAPLSLGNGKSVYYLEPYIYLGRTVASFELFLLQIKNLILNYINKFKGYGSIDAIQPVGENLLILSSSENKEFQLYDIKLNLLKTIDLPARVDSYTCFDEGLLFALTINNQPNLLWLK